MVYVCTVPSKTVSVGNNCFNLNYIHFIKFIDIPSFMKTTKKKKNVKTTAKKMTNYGISPLIFFNMHVFYIIENRKNSLFN